MRILYCVTGEGRGHSTRTLEVVRELSKRHKVKVLAAGVSYTFLKPKLDDVERIESFRMVYVRNASSNLLAFFRNLLIFPFILAYDLKIFFRILSFKPDVVVSDFEPFSSCFSAVLGKPLLTIDNLHTIPLEKNIESRFFSLAFLKLLIRTYIPYRTSSLALSFAHHESKNRKTIVVPPVIRSEVLALKPSRKDFILVYQTSKNYDRIVRILHQVDERFIIPDARKAGVSKNVVFRKIGENNFLEDLGSCKAVISNGGFSLITEALYLGKPVLSEPVRNQMEQYLNARHLKELGFGDMCERLSVKKIREFVSNLRTYEDNLKSYRNIGNDVFFRILESALYKARMKCLKK